MAKRVVAVALLDVLMDRSGGWEGKPGKCIEGAADFMQELSTWAEVVVVAEPEAPEQAKDFCSTTQHWLAKHGIMFSRLVTQAEALRADALISSRAIRCAPHLSKSPRAAYMCAVWMAKEASGG